MALTDAVAGRYIDDITKRTVAAPAAPTLAAPTTATTGGTLAAATYYYVVTATGATGETVKSNEVSQATTGTTSTVSLSWNFQPGASGYKIYRGTAAGGEAYLTSVGGAVTSFTDTGAATSAGSPPGSTNATVGTYFTLLQSDIAGTDSMATMLEDTTAGGGRKAVTWTAPAGSPPTSSPTADVQFGPYTADMANPVTVLALVDAASGTTGTIRRTFPLNSSYQPKSGDFLTLSAADLALGIQ